MSDNLIIRFAKELKKNGIRSAVGKSFIKVGNKLASSRKTVVTKDNTDKVLFPKEAENIEKQFACIPKECNRLAVFASFSADGLIHKDVVYYLSELKKVVDVIVFIADNPIIPEEIEKLRGLVIYAKCARHQEYDFGSYKRGYNWAAKNELLDNTKELIFCNDSCYGPVYPFSIIFEEMETRTCDFWGMLVGTEGFSYLQSYFMVFKKHVFSSTVFEGFIKSIKGGNISPKTLQGYQAKLNRLLCLSGFTGGSYMTFYPRCNIYPFNLRDLTRMPVWATQQGFPFVRKDALSVENDFNIEGVYNTYQYFQKCFPEAFEIMEKTCPPDCNNSFDFTFSIIMPTLNRKHLIDNAINSALKQTYQKFELIIVDDGSTDGTRDYIFQKYRKELQDEKIRYFYLDHQGVCKARNIGLANAKNEWIAYLDTDNLINRDFLRMFCEEIEKFPDIRLFYAKAECIYSNRVIGHPFVRQQLLLANYIDLGTFIHKKDVYYELGGFDENMTRLVDWDLITTYSHNNPIQFIDKKVLLYNDGDDPNRISKKESRSENLEYFQKKHGTIRVSTFIIPNHSEKYQLRHTIDSAICQIGNFTHEIFVYDNGCSEIITNTIEEYMALYPGMIRKFNSQDCLQNEMGINFEDCRPGNHFIAFIIGNDYWIDNKKLFLQIELLLKHRDCGVAVSNGKAYNATTKDFCNDISGESLPEIFTNKLPFESTDSWKISLSNCLFDADSVKEIMSVLHENDSQGIPLAFYLEYFDKIAYAANTFTIHPLPLQREKSSIETVEENILNVINNFCLQN